MKTPPADPPLISAYCFFSLTGVKLTNTNLTNTNLTNTNLTNAMLGDANLFGVTDAAKYNSLTILPAGFDPVAAGWTLVS